MCLHKHRHLHTLQQIGNSFVSLHNSSKSSFPIFHSHLLLFIILPQILSSGCSQKNNLDIAFIVDSSASLSSQDFEDTKMFIRSVLGKFDIGLNKTRVALIKYRYCFFFFQNKENWKKNYFQTKSKVNAQVYMQPMCQIAWFPFYEFLN